MEADAKQIAEKTGKAGYAEMGKDDNTAGWILTTLVYALGGRMETGTGTKAKATLNNPQTVTALNILKKMRWTDNSMGSNFDYGWSDINQAFAAGTVGMYISGSDVYTNLVPASNIDPSIYGVATIPLAKNPNAGVLGGGTLAAVRPGANAAQRRGREVDRLLLRAATDQQAQAIRNAKTLVASKQPVGVPALPIFNKAQYDAGEHVDQALHQRAAGQMKPFTTGIFNQKLGSGAGGIDAERLPLARRGGGSGAHRQERRTSQMLQQANSTAQSAISQGK